MLSIHDAVPETRSACATFIGSNNVVSVIADPPSEAQVQILCGKSLSGNSNGLHGFRSSMVVDRPGPYPRIQSSSALPGRCFAPYVGRNLKPSPDEINKRTCGSTRKHMHPANIEELHAVRLPG